MLLCMTSMSVAIAQEKGDDKPAGRISGLMFGDFFYHAQRDASFASLKNTAVTGDRHARGFQFRRIYLTYDHDISQRFTTRLRFEADQVELTSRKDKSSKTTVIVKDAYLKWNGIFSGSDLILGIQPPPAFEISESVWGCRPLEKTILDLRGIVGSRDFGVSLKGRIDAAGRYNYWVMYGNNSGVNAEADKHNRFYGHVHVKPMTDGHFTLYADFNQRAKIMRADSSGMVDNNATTVGVFLGYGRKDAFAIGLEGFIQSTQNGLKLGSDNKTNSALGWSVFGTYHVMPDWVLVGRYDSFDPSNDEEVKGDTRHYLLGGVTWKADTNVSFTPNVQVEIFEKPPGGETPDPSVTYRITFFYVFK